MLPLRAASFARAGLRMQNAPTARLALLRVPQSYPAVLLLTPRALFSAQPDPSQQQQPQPPQEQGAAPPGQPTQGGHHKTFSGVRGKAGSAQKARQKKTRATANLLFARVIPLSPLTHISPLSRLHAARVLGDARPCRRRGRRRHHLQQRRAGEEEV
jgi:hypothetical protein